MNEMISSTQRTSRGPSMTLSLEHVLHGLALLESSKLLPGANYYFRGATPRGLCKAVIARQQQQNSHVRTGLTASNRHAAAQRSRAACMGQSSHRAKRRSSRQLDSAASNETTQPDRLKAAARDAQQSGRRSPRASTLTQRRSKATGLLFSTGQRSRAARARSRAARARAFADKRHANACKLPAQAWSTQRASLASLKWSSRRPRGTASRRTSQPEGLQRAAREAHLMQSRAQRANALSSKRGQITETVTSAARDGPASGPISPTTDTGQQQALMQEDAGSAPANMHQPQCATSSAAVQQHTNSAQLPLQSSSGSEYCVRLSECTGSPGMPEWAQGQNATASVDPLAAAEPTGRALKGSTKAEAPTKQQEQAPTLEPGTTGMSASVCAMQSARSPGRRSMHSAVSSDGSSKMFTEAEVSAKAHAESPSVEDGIDHCADLRRHCLGSPGMPEWAKEQETFHSLTAPETPQPKCPPLALPAQGVLRRKFAGEMHTQQQERAPTLELGSTGISSAAPAPADCSSGYHSVHDIIGSGGYPDASVAADARRTQSSQRQPPCASIAAAQQQAFAPEQHSVPAQLQRQIRRGPDHCADQGRQFMSSSEMPKWAMEQNTRHGLDAPTTPQRCRPAVAELAGESLNSSPRGLRLVQWEETALTEEPGRIGMSPVTPVQLSHSSGRHSMQSVLSGGGSPEVNTETSTPAPATEHFLSLGMPEPLQGVSLSSSSEEGLPPKTSPVGIPQSSREWLIDYLSDATGQVGSRSRDTMLRMLAHRERGRRLAVSCNNSSPLSLSQAAAERPASRFSPTTRHAPAQLPSKPLLCTDGSAPRSAPSAQAEQSAIYHTAPESQEAVASPQGLRESPHPKTPKGKPIIRPNWRTDSPEKAHAWLLYTDVLHRGRGGGAADYQTVSMELPKQTVEKRRPRFGNKSLLQVETRLEDVITKPKKARVGKLQRNKILMKNGGQLPKPGDKHYKLYRLCCKMCEGYF